MTTATTYYVANVWRNVYWHDASNNDMTMTAASNKPIWEKIIIIMWNDNDSNDNENEKPTNDIIMT